MSLCARRSLRSKGLFHRVRQVVDIRDTYYLAAEYHYCPGCDGTFLSTDPRLVDQLSDGLRGRYPVVTSRKSACDRAVIGLLRGRTLGNSPTALCRAIAERHSEEYSLRVLAYLADCRRHQ